MNLTRQALQHAMDAMKHGGTRMLQRAAWGAARIAVAQARPAATGEEWTLLTMADTSLSYLLAYYQPRAITMVTAEIRAGNVQLAETKHAIEAWLDRETVQLDLTPAGILATMRANGLHAEADEVDRLLTAVGAGPVRVR